MADGSNSASTAELGITQQDLGVKPQAPGIRLSKPPRILRQFSRQQSPEERQALAAQIKDKRKEHFAKKAERLIKESEITANTLELANLDEALAEIPDSWFGRALNYRRLRDLREKEGSLRSTNEAIQAELSSMAYTERALAERGMPVNRLDQAKKLVNEFYEREKIKWEEAPYSKEEAEHLFTDEHLASLTTEEYIVLLKRFPSDMVTHVTRQGIRDHVGMSEHIAGVGKFQDGFTKLLPEGRLRSVMGIYGRNGITEQAILNYLEYMEKAVKEIVKDPKIAHESAIDALENVIEPMTGRPGGYYDIASVHFAGGVVADQYYGAETGNEIFFVFPGIYIASQHFFGGEAYMSEAHNSTLSDTFDRNNIYVWSESNDGIPLDAGFVFIPKEARVDPKTGSKYALDSEGKPIERTDQIEALAAFVNSPGFSEVIDLQSKISQTALKEERLKIPQLIDSFKTRLSQEFGIQDPKLQDAIANYQNMVDLVRSIPTGNPEHDMYYPRTHEIIKKVLLKEGLLYQKATDTISSQEYWENYFAQHPEQRPKRIVYYEGEDPTEALQKWRDENGLSKRSDDETFGFPERNIDQHDPRANIGYDRFRSLAEKVIRENSTIEQPKAA